MREISITDIGGFRVGHAEYSEAGTGCTVVLFDRLTTTGISVRGGGPASRDTRLLDPLMSNEGINAVLLSGGSAFGLDAAGGVMRWLEERGEGVNVAGITVPLVCQSCVFDLNVGRGDIRPDAELAKLACDRASYAAPEMGNVGAGAGCSVGKVLGIEKSMKSGFGTFALESGELKVGALVAVNAVGDVYDGHERIAGVRDERGRSAEEIIAEDFTGPEPAPGANTTIGLIVTNARLSKAQLCKAADMSHDGYARAIRPVHTLLDGDSIYAASVGDVPANLDAVGVMASVAMERAIVRAVRASASACGLPGLGDGE
ncbi:MAG: P1 family peptidase [Oscillospiraceae bacterium]|nr:P1 family peptidase [Oscillospiraceae bacterium]